VANIAHGVGALLGVAVAWAMARSERRRLRQAYGVPVGLVVALVFAAVFARPFVNLAPHRGWQESVLAYEALQRNDDATALRWSRQATR
jgi:hypothetical protein